MLPVLACLGAAWAIVLGGFVVYVSVIGILRTRRIRRRLREAREDHPRR